MTDVANRLSRRAWHVGALAFLLPLALGTGAGAQTQTPARWAPAAIAGAQRAPLPPVVRNPLPITPGFDVAQVEALAQSLVANQKVPGLAIDRKS
ncbi:MAG: hypothetical protein EPO46_07270, partial [Lysobacter sp.]